MTSKETQNKLKTDIRLLNKCIKEKWEPVRDGKISLIVTDCALCAEYHNETCTSDTNDVCPIAVYAGKINCHNTPYYDIILSIEINYFKCKTKSHPEAQKEIDFLIKVRDSLIKKQIK